MKRKGTKKLAQSDTQSIVTEPENNMGDALKFWRNAKGLTQQALAKLSGVSLATIAKIETTPRTGTYETHKKLADALKITVFQLRQGQTAITETPSTALVSNSMIVEPDYVIEIDTRLSLKPVEYVSPAGINGHKKTFRELAEAIEGFQLTALIGVPGAGKATLARRLINRIRTEGIFDWIFWISLKEPEELEETAKKIVDYLDKYPQNWDAAKLGLKDKSKTIIEQLYDYLKEVRCLIVFDRFEQILDTEIYGSYKKEYKDYDTDLLQKMADFQKSKLLLISSEKPKGFGPGGSHNLYGKLIMVGRVELEEAKQIFDGIQFKADQGEFEDIYRLYAANPLALYAVSELIRDAYKNDATAFLATKVLVFGRIEEILEQRFKRVPELQKRLLYWLAIEQQDLTPQEIADSLVEDVLSRVDQQKLREGLDTLRLRWLIGLGKQPGSFDQPKVIREYITKKLVEGFVRDIETGSEGQKGKACPDEAGYHLRNFSLLNPTADEPVRQAQVQNILKPIISLLLSHYKSERRLVNRLKELLEKLQPELPEEQGYAPANLINLLYNLKDKSGSELNEALKGLDFSNMNIVRAYFQGANLQDAKFNGAYIANSVFQGSFSIILAVATSPDGKWLAISGLSTGIMLLDLQTRQWIKTLEGHTAWIWSLSFSPDSSLLASGSGDQTVRVWDVNTGQTRKILQSRANMSQGHTRRVRAVAFSPDGKWLASGGDDSRVILWRTSEAEPFITLPGSNNAIYALAFYHFKKENKTILASGGDDSVIRLWEVAESKTDLTQKELEGHTLRIRSLNFSSDGSILASGSEDRTIKLWKPVAEGNWEVANTLEENTGWVSSVAFSPNTNTESAILAAGSYDRTIRLWEVNLKTATTTPAETLRGHTGWIRVLTFTVDGLLATGGEDCSLRLWDVDEKSCLRVFQGYASRVQSLAFSPDGSLLASGNEDSSIRIWDVQNEKAEPKTLRDHDGFIWTVAFSKSGVLASSSEDRSIKLWDVYGGRCIKTLPGNRGAMLGIAFSNDNIWLTSGSGVGTIRVWDINSPEKSYKLTNVNDEKEVGDWVRAVAYSPDGKWLAASVSDGKVAIWAVAEIREGNNNEPSHKFEARVGLIWCLAFSPDSKYLAIGGEDLVLRVWDFEKETEYKSLEGHLGVISTVAFSSDGKLVSGGSDGLLKLWEWENSSYGKTLKVYPNWIRSVTFSPDGKMLACAGEDGIIELWDMSKPEPEMISCRAIPRPYEGMAIKGVEGLTGSQLANLKNLGATDTVTLPTSIK